MAVRPVLEVLLGKTVEQALLEVMEEEELASLRAQQRAFQELRNAELVEVQRLEEQERRHREEKVPCWQTALTCTVMSQWDLVLWMLVPFTIRLRKSL